VKSELSFLLELVLDEQVPQPIKTRLVKRIQDVEKSYVSPHQQARGPGHGPKALTGNPIVATQSPSMQRIMEKNPDLIPKPPMPENAVTAKALADRQALINQAISGKEEKGRVSPRKF